MSDLTRKPGVTEPYVTLLPATEGNCRTLTDCFGPMAPAALAALYLRAGKYMPELAKRKGAYIGLCDEAGLCCPDKTKVTHIGITAGDDDEMEVSDVR